MDSTEGNCDAAEDKPVLMFKIASKSKNVFRLNGFSQSYLNGKNFKTVGTIWGSIPNKMLQRFKSKCELLSFESNVSNQKNPLSLSGADSLIESALDKETSRSSASYGSSRFSGDVKMITSL